MILVIEGSTLKNSKIIEREGFELKTDWFIRSASLTETSSVSDTITAIVIEQ